MIKCYIEKDKSWTESKIYTCTVVLFSFFFSFLLKGALATMQPFECFVIAGFQLKKTNDYFGKVLVSHQTHTFIYSEKKLNCHPIYRLDILNIYVHFKQKALRNKQRYSAVKKTWLAL